MARKRGGQPKKVKATGRIVVACTPEYEEHFTKIANDELRTNASAAFDRIFAEWCQAKGLPEPPKRI